MTKQLTREQVAEQLGNYYSKKFNGKVTSSYDDQKRAYEIHGSALPAKYDMYGNPAQPGATWAMLDYVKPSKARQLIAEED